MDSEHSRDPITFREALTMFASKADILEIKAELGVIGKKMDAIVPRAEHELRDKMWTDRFQEQKDAVTKMDADHESRLRSLERIVVPQWVLTLAAPVLTGIALYFLLPHAH